MNGLLTKTGWSMESNENHRYKPTHLSTVNFLLRKKSHNKKTSSTIDVGLDACI